MKALWGAWIFLGKVNKRGIQNYVQKTIQNMNKMRDLRSFVIQKKVRVKKFILDAFTKMGMFLLEVASNQKTTK